MEQLKTPEVYREYWYRWVVLALFFATSAVGGMANTTCAPITIQVADIYDLPKIVVEMNMMIYELVFIVVIFPCNYLVDTYGLSVSVRYR